MAFSSLEIGKRALAAQKLGLDVAQNNVANINTPGYSRREAVLSETSPYNQSGVFIGTGVMAEALRTFRDEFFDREIRGNVSRASSFEYDDKVMQRIETILLEPTDDGISELSTRFFNTFEDLAIKPEDTAVRDNVMAVGQTLTDRLNHVARQASDTREELASDIRLKIDEANSIIKDIASYNKSITAAAVQSPQGSQTMIDQRELLLEELSEILQITVTQQENGALNVYSGGINLITGPVSGKLEAHESTNTATGERTIRIYRLSENGTKNIINTEEGALASLTEHFNVTLDDKDSSGGFSVIKEIDEYSSALARKVNNLTMSGYGLDDTDAAPPARTFFEPSAGDVTAASITISSDILGKPRDLPVSSAPNEPGNSSIALEIAQLSKDNDFWDNSTPSEYFSEFLGRIANMATEIDNGMQTSGLISDQLKSQRESLIGVNSDEEAINLIKYQKSFEAASRVINTTDDMLSIIINLGR